MDTPAFYFDPPVSADSPAREARGLFAAGWYATREEGRLVHPAEQTEQTVSPEVGRALRELGAGATAAPVVHEAA